MFCNVQNIVRWSLTNIKNSLVVRHILNTYHINCGFLSPERSRNNTHDKLRYLFWRFWYHRSYFFFGRLFVLQKCDGHLTMSSRVVTSFILLTVSNVVGPPSSLRSHKYHLPPPLSEKIPYHLLHHFPLLPQNWNRNFRMNGLELPYLPWREISPGQVR